MMMISWPIYQDHPSRPIKFTEENSQSLSPLLLVTNYFLFSIYYKTLHLCYLNAEFSNLYQLPPACYVWDASTQ